MRDFIILFVHVIVTVVRLVGPGGLRSVVAESALVVPVAKTLSRVVPDSSCHMIYEFAMDVFTARVTGKGTGDSLRQTTTLSRSSMTPTTIEN